MVSPLSLLLFYLLDGYVPQLLQQLSWILRFRGVSMLLRLLPPAASVARRHVKVRRCSCCPLFIFSPLSPSFLPFFYISYLPPTFSSSSSHHSEGTSAAKDTVATTNYAANRAKKVARTRRCAVKSGFARALRSRPPGCLYRMSAKFGLMIATSD